MKKLQSTLPNMLLSLGIITLIAGLMLGYMYKLTKEPIEQMRQETQIKAIADVAPKFTNNPEADKWVYTDPTDGNCTVYPAFDGDKLIGCAVETSSNSGFAGEIKIMVGFNADSTIRNYVVLSHSETPGLGSKMDTWFRNPEKNRSIIGKSPESTSFYVSKDSENHGEIDAITAATISSRAFLESIRKAYKAFQQYSQTQNGQK